MDKIYVKADEYWYTRDLTEYGWRVIVSQDSRDYNASILMIEEFTQKINSYKQKFDANKCPHSSELGELGLINIYLRIQLKYGGQVQMTIENNLDDGGKVSILIPLLKEGGEASCTE